MLRANRRDVLRIAPEHLRDPLFVLFLFFVVAGRVDDELRPVLVANYERDLFAVPREGGIAAAARRVEPQLTFMQSLFPRALRQLRGEEAVQLLRRIAEHAFERRLECARLARRPAR